MRMVTGNDSPPGCLVAASWPAARAAIKPTVTTTAIATRGLSVDMVSVPRGVPASTYESQLAGCSTAVPDAPYLIVMALAPPGSMLRCGLRTPADSLVPLRRHRCDRQIAAGCLRCGTPRAQVIDEFLHARAGLRRELEDFHPRPHGLDALVRGRGVKFYSRGQIGLGDDRHVRRVEDRRILPGLVFPLGHREQHQTQVLAQVEGRGADEVADVFDEQVVELLERPATECVSYHRRLEVADCACGDLLDRGSAAG